MPIDVDDLLEVAEHCGATGRLVPIRSDGDEVDAFREPRRIDYLPEFAVAAGRIHIVIVYQWTMFRDEAFEAVLSGPWDLKSTVLFPLY